MSEIYAQTRIADLRRQLSRDELLDIENRLSNTRKSSGLVAGLAAIGFLGIAGVHRFVLGDVAMGILMLITLGGCGIWTIIDLINANKMTERYNLNLELQYINDAVRAKELRGDQSTNA